MKRGELKMRNTLWQRLILGWMVLLIGLSWGCGAVAETDSGYQRVLLPNPDGIGKVYMGRPIAKVMGHAGLYWLERPQRQQQEQPDRVIEALDLQPTDVVADMGAGSGYFSARLSQRVPQGKVLAVDIQPEMIEFLQLRAQEEGISNIEPILGEVDDPHLPPESVDLALMVDAYHEFAYPREMMQGIVSGLRPGGRVVLVEYKKENPLIPIKALHKMSQIQVRREMEAVGLHWLEAKPVVPQQHVLVFQKPIQPT